MLLISSLPQSSVEECLASWARPISTAVKETSELDKFPRVDPPPSKNQNGEIRVFLLLADS